jgi:hypothetical protein
MEAAMSNVTEDELYEMVNIYPADPPETPPEPVAKDGRDGRLFDSQRRISPGFAGSERLHYPGLGRPSA